MGDGLREGGRQVEGAHLSNCKVWIDLISVTSVEEGEDFSNSVQSSKLKPCSSRMSHNHSLSIEITLFKKGHSDFIPMY